MIEQHLQNIEAEIQAIRDLLSFKIEVEYTGELFRISWQPREGTGDILYGINSLEHSYKKNVGEIDLSTGSVDIQVFKQDIWKFKMTGDVESDVVKCVNIKPDSDPVDYDFWNSLWDSHNYGGDEFNTEKTTGFKDAKKILEKGKNCILSLSHRWEGKSRTEWQSMIGWMSDEIKQLDSHNLRILIQDEPWSNGFTTDEVNFLYDEFKKAAPDYKFGYSITRNGLRREVPDGFKTDFGILPLYLFSGEITREEFDEYFDEHIRIAREKMDTEIFVLGQGFYNQNHKQDWTQPPLWAIRAYVEAIIRHKLKGVLWYLCSHDQSHTRGLEYMPEYFREVKSLL